MQKIQDRLDNLHAAIDNPLNVHCPPFQEVSNSDSRYSLYSQVQSS